MGDVIQLDRNLFKTGKEPRYLGIQFKHLMEVNAFAVFTLISVLLNAQFY